MRRPSAWSEDSSQSRIRKLIFQLVTNLHMRYTQPKSFDSDISFNFCDQTAFESPQFFYKLEKTRTFSYTKKCLQLTLKAPTHMCRHSVNFFSYPWKFNRLCHICGPTIVIQRFNTACNRLGSTKTTLPVFARTIEFTP